MKSKKLYTRAALTRAPMVVDLKKFAGTPVIIESISDFEPRDTMRLAEYVLRKAPWSELRISEAQQRLTALRTRMDQMYEEKLDGKISEEFWTRKMNEWREQERTLEEQLLSLSAPLSTDSVLTVQRIFELVNRAHFLYLTRNSAERGQLLKSVLLNCSTDGVNLWPRNGKPFDLIFRIRKN